MKIQGFLPADALDLVADFQWPVIFAKGKLLELRSKGADQSPQIAGVILQISNGTDPGLVQYLLRDLAHTVQVKVRYSDFATLTRQISVEDPIAEASDVYRLACFLLAREKLVTRPLRLLGLGVSNLREPTTRQLALF